MCWRSEKAVVLRRGDDDFEGPRAVRDAKDEGVVEGLSPFEDEALATEWLAQVDAADALAIGQEWADAMNDAATLSRAADAMRLAASFLTA